MPIVSADTYENLVAGACKLARHTLLDDLLHPARTLLIDKAKQLAETHNIDAALAQAGLQALTEGLAPAVISDPEGFPEALRSFPLTLLADILRSFPRDEAVRIIEQEDLPRLARHVQLVKYLMDEEIPFLTLPELAAHTQSFIQFLKEHQDYMVKTGLPPRCFRPCRWLYVQLGRLYDTRVPSSIYPCDELLPHSEEDPEPEPYRWLRTPSAEERAHGQHHFIECSPEEADVRHGMDSKDARRIEWNRHKLFQVKLCIVELLHDAVTRRRVEDLWPACLAELTKGLASEDVEFFLRMDRFYLGEDALDGLPDGMSLEWSPGGLTNLLQVIGHFESEIRIGTLSRTKEAMPPSLVTAFHELISPVGDDESCEVGYSPWQYFKLMTRQDRAELNEVLDAMFDQAKQETSFWQDYRSRVREALFPDSSTPTPIELNPKHVHLLLPLVKTCVEQLGQECEKGKTAVPPPQGLAVFRKEGDSWTIIFDGKVTGRADSVGLFYIAQLLKSPKKPFSPADLQKIFHGSRVDPNDPLRSRAGAIVVVRGSRGNDDDSNSETLSISSPDMGDVSDGPAVNQYRDALDELEEQERRARAANDKSRLIELEHTKKKVSEQLRNAITITGRHRKVSPHEKKARDSVANAVNRAKEDLRTAHPALWKHLAHSLRTGPVCLYAPDQPVDWQF